VLNRYRLPKRCRSEDGSVMMAMTVVMVVSFLIVAVLLTVSGGLTSARNDQNRTNAFQYANAGIDQVLYRLDTSETATTAAGSYVPTRCYAPPSNSCGAAGAVVTAFTDSVTSGTSGYDVIVTAVPDGQRTSWKVQSKGLDQSGRQRQAITTIKATPIFQNGFLTVNNFYTNGNQDYPAGYNSALCPDPRNNSAAGCDLTNGGTQPVPTRIGTNGVLRLASSTAADYFNSWEGADMWGRSTQAAADADCEVGGQMCKDKNGYVAGWVTPHTNQHDVTYFPTDGASACPNPTGTFTNTAIAPGKYRCPQLNLSGVISVSGTGNVIFVVDGAVTINPDAKVNVGQATVRFQVYQNPAGPAAGAFCGQGSDNPQFWGMLSAPRLEIGCNGSSQPEVYGAVIAKFYDGPGSHFKFHWDSQTQYAVNDGKYVVKNWRECPPNASDC